MAAPEQDSQDVLEQIDLDAFQRCQDELRARYRDAARQEILAQASPEDDDLEARVDELVDWTLANGGADRAHAVGLRLMRSVTAEQQRDQDEQHRLGGGSRGFAVAVGWQPLESCKEAVDFRRVAATAARRPRRRGAGRPAGARRRATATRAGPGSSDDGPEPPPPAAPRLTLAPKQTIYSFACLSPEQRGEA